MSARPWHNRGTAFVNRYEPLGTTREHHVERVHQVNLALTTRVACWGDRLILDPRGLHARSMLSVALGPRCIGALISALSFL